MAVAGNIILEVLVRYHFVRQTSLEEVIDALRKLEAEEEDI